MIAMPLSPALPVVKKKIFILDTNVLLHDYTCIYNFEENDVVIPIVVLEELDKVQAREVT